MVAGTILNIIGLGLLALSTNQMTFIGAYLVVQLSNNAAGAAYTGVIPDVVRAEDRGRASGLLGTMNQLGTVVGVGLVGLTFKLYGDTRAGLLAGYAVVAVILAITLLITVIAVKEPVLISLPRSRGRVRVGAGAVICGAAFLVGLIALFAILLIQLGSLLWPVVIVFVAAAVTTFLAARRLPALMAFFQAFRSNDFSEEKFTSLNAFFHDNIAYFDSVVGSNAILSSRIADSGENFCRLIRFSSFTVAHGLCPTTWSTPTSMA